MVSIIIPVYKTEPYLRKCLDSVCGQTDRDLEIIVINDGSPDNSKSILEEYLAVDHRIRIIDQENSGLSSARNAGLARASGEYVLFLDSDDWMDTDVCEKAIALAEAEQADIVMWSYYREYGTVSKPAYIFGTEPKVFRAGDPDFPYRMIVGPVEKELGMPQQIDRAVTVWGKLYRREIIGDALFVDTKIIGTEDCLFNVQVFSRARTVAYLPDAMNHYRKDNTTSLTTGYDPKLADKWKENYNRIRRHLTQNDAPEIFFQALSNRMCCGLIGLGIRLSSSTGMSNYEKRQEMKRILEMEHYRDALKQLNTSPMPVYWKLFFFHAKHKQAGALLMDLRSMRLINQLTTRR